ncbi:MAG: methionine--tRNA ligase [Gemmatimonadota bacterium]|nr:methionine--tRNA ligase [Gemmatimonadota bacterium]
MNNRFFITTAIDYANGLPHIGHALEKIGADTIARYRRHRGDSVHFLMGMDEHGLKIAQSAAAAGVSPIEWTTRLAGEWRAAWQLLDISYDDFIRTTEPRHAVGVYEMIRRIRENGDLYQATYAGFYCVGCEAYKSEDDLVDGHCPEHPSREIQWLEEENWFFRLSAYRDRLRALVTESDFVRPESRRNEVLRMIDEIKDISVSRAGLKWGIRWPDEPETAVYVWLDALTNYLSATGFPAEGYERLWPADLHVVGKDIIRFHCVYWPAMLMSAGVETPRGVWAHGWMTMSGGKISKSEGGTIGIPAAVERHGADAFRYFVLREVPWDSDGNFSWDRLAERDTSELANDLGNLANRTLSMIHRYRGGVVPEAPATTELDQIAKETVEKYLERMDRLALHEAAAAVFELVSRANSFVESRAPWKLARDPANAGSLDETLASLARALGVVSGLLHPFMPGRMGELWTSLGTSETIPPFEDLASLDLTGRTVSMGAVLFPRPELAK